MKDKVIDIIVANTGVKKESITLETNLLNDLDLESLDLVDLIVAFEDAFEFEIPDKDIKKLQTVGDIVNYVEKVQGTNE